MQPGPLMRQFMSRLEQLCEIPVGYGACPGFSLRITSFFSRKQVAPAEKAI